MRKAPAAMPVDDPAIPGDGVSISMLGYHDFSENLPETAMRIRTFLRPMGGVRCIQELILCLTPYLGTCFFTTTICDSSHRQIT